MKKPRPKPADIDARSIDSIAHEYPPPLPVNMPDDVIVPYREVAGLLAALAKLQEAEAKKTE